MTRGLRHERWFRLSLLLFGFALLLSGLSRPFDRHAPFALVHWPDSATYRQLSFIGNAIRLPTVPLLYRVIPWDQGRVLLQLVFSGVCWAMLAAELATPIRRRAARVAVVLAVLVWPLTVQVEQWNQIILSESVAISLTVLLLALWLRFLRVRSWRRLAPLLVVTFLWVMTRQLQAMVGVTLVLPPLILLAVHRGERRMHAVAALVTAASVGWALALTVFAPPTRGIGYYNSIEIIANRVLLDPAETLFMERHGMPQPTSAQRAAAGHFASQQSVFTDDQQLHQYAYSAAWHGAYRTWTLTHPLDAAVAPVVDARLFAATDPAYGPMRRVLPHPIQWRLWPDSSGWQVANHQQRGEVPWLLLVEVSVGAFAVVRGWRRVEARAVIFAGLIGYLWLVATWVLSAWELPRLVAPAIALVHVLPVVAVAALVTDHEPVSRAADVG